VKGKKNMSLHLAVIL